MELQGQIYLKYIKQNIKQNIKLNLLSDNKMFKLITEEQELNDTHNKYHIYLKGKNNSHVNFYDSVILKK
jgi:hypothetical protein